MRSAVYPERNRRGYTLIELLVVISIIAILSVIAFVNIKDFSSAQALKKAAGEVQSILRLAQSNASSSTQCNDNSYGVAWGITFAVDQRTITLNCNSNATPYKTLTFPTGINIQSITSTNPTNNTVVCTLNLPVKVSYSALKGLPTVSNNDHRSSDSTDTCLGQGQNVNINITKNSDTKVVNFTSGGGINVQ